MIDYLWRTEAKTAKLRRNDSNSKLKSKFEDLYILAENTMDTTDLKQMGGDSK